MKTLDPKSREVAPETPSKAVRQRVDRVQATLLGALDVLEERGLQEIGSTKKRLLFDKTDVERGLEFHTEMKLRFRDDLRLLGLSVMS